MKAARIRNITLLGLGLWLVMGIRLVWLQVVKADTFKAWAQKQHQFRVGLLPERGVIYDRQGRPLAFSVNGARSYPYGAAATQTLGVVGIDGRGLEGLELLYDDLLRGEAGWSIKQLDARGRTHPLAEYPLKPAQGGGSLILTLDADLQTIAAQELERGASKYRALSATALITDPQSGEILALACYPPVSPSRFDGVEQSQLINKAIAEQFEPGSTFKTITMAAALEEGLIKPEDIIDGEGGHYAVGGHTIGEAEGHQYGKLTAIQALAYSSNICLAKIGGRLGRERLYQYARAFGFGSKTGIEFPGEAAGLLSKPNEWSLIQCANISFGQGLSVTALQLAAAYGALANGGFLIRPKLVRELMDGQGQRMTNIGVDTLRRAVSAKTAAIIREMLEQAVADSMGTGRNARVPGWRVAGKTGTAQRKAPGQKGYHPDLYTASFVGFLPADDPRILAVIVVNEPRGSYYGGKVAAPIFASIMKRALSLPRGPAPELLAMSSYGDSSAHR